MFQDLLIRLIRKINQEVSCQYYKSDAYIRLLQTWQTKQNKESQD